MASALSPAASAHFQRRNHSMAASSHQDTSIPHRELKFIPFQLNIPGATVLRSIGDSSVKIAPKYLPTRSTTRVISSQNKENFQRESNLNGSQTTRGQGASLAYCSGYPSDTSYSTYQSALHQKVQSGSAPGSGGQVEKINYNQYTNVPQASQYPVRPKFRNLKTLSSTSSTSTSSTKTSCTEKFVMIVPPPPPPLIPPPPPPSHNSYASAAFFSMGRRSGAVSSNASNVGLHKRQISLAKNQQPQHHRSTMSLYSGYQQHVNQATSNMRNYPEFVHNFQRTTTNTTKTPSNQPAAGNLRQRPLVTNPVPKGDFFSDQKSTNHIIASDTSPSPSSCGPFVNGLASYNNIPFAPQGSHSSLSSYAVGEVSTTRQRYSNLHSEEPHFGSLYRNKNFDDGSKIATEDFESASSSNTPSKYSVENNWTQPASKINIEDHKTPFTSGRRRSSTGNSSQFSPFLRKAVKDLPNIEVASK
eukprot:GHVP01035239.1.p1 GENE.GHVP01035239.1~~GHVP01035239.1.p1  ORF type:complete len:473 (+),score=38.32 GHVP01035239.1:55-1473(+)